MPVYLARSDYSIAPLWWTAGQWTTEYIDRRSSAILAARYLQRWMVQSLGLLHCFNLSLPCLRPPMPRRY